jgi:hypothetical protein
VLFAIGFLFEKIAVNKEKETEKLQPGLSEAQSKSDRFDAAYKKMLKSQKEAGQITAWLHGRFYWCDFLSEMRLALIRSEEATKKKLSAQKPGVEAGIWVEQMISAPGLGGVALMTPGAEGMPPTPAPTPQVDANGQPVQQGQAGTNAIVLVCRAVDLKSVDAAADTQIAYTVENEIKNSPLVDPKATALAGSIVSDESNGTFTFTINVTPATLPNF